jgi:hypothetical protein
MSKEMRNLMNDFHRKSSSINENKKSKKVIKEGIGTALLVLSGVGVIFLIKKIKNFIDKTAKFMPSASLGLFLSKVKAVEEGRENGEIIVKDKGNHKIIGIIIDGKVFDSLTVDVVENEIYRGHAVEPKRSDIIIPMQLPSSANTEDIEEIEEMEELLINDILAIIVKYSEPKSGME